MGTRSLTTIKDENQNPLLSFYRQLDGYFEGHGKELQDFLTEFKIVNGYGIAPGDKVANGMGCLAAQIIAHFKHGIGGIYIVSHTDTQQFNYTISLNSKNQLTLVGTTGAESKVFELYPNSIVAEDEDIGYNEIAEFVYNTDAFTPKWRRIGVKERTSTYISGKDLDDGGKFKRFNLSKIVGGADKIKYTDV